MFPFLCKRLRVTFDIHLRLELSETQNPLFLRRQLVHHLEPSLLRGIPNLNISVEDTVLGTGRLLLEVALPGMPGEEGMSGPSCSPFVNLRVQGTFVSLRSQRCAVSSVGRRRLMRGTSEL